MAELRRFLLESCLDGERWSRSTVTIPPDVDGSASSAHHSGRNVGGDRAPRARGVSISSWRNSARSRGVAPVCAKRRAAHRARGMAGGSSRWGKRTIAPCFTRRWWIRARGPRSKVQTCRVRTERSSLRRDALCSCTGTWMSPRCRPPFRCSTASSGRRMRRRRGCSTRNSGCSLRRFVRCATAGLDARVAVDGDRAARRRRDDPRARRNHAAQPRHPRRRASRRSRVDRRRDADNNLDAEPELWDPNTRSTSVLLVRQRASNT